MEVIIHLGLHKTASTWLQEALFSELRDTLLITRPFTIFSDAFNTLKYANDIDYLHNDLVDCIERIVKANESCNRVLISDEALNGLPKYNYLNRTVIAQRLSEAFPQAKVILFIRAQQDLIPSLYNQAIKSGWLRMLPEYFIWSKKESGYTFSESDKIGYNFDYAYMNYYHTLNIENFNYLKLITYYKKVFDDVNIFLYEDVVNRPDWVLSQLSILIGENLNQKLINKRVNTRLSDNKMMVKLAANLARFAARSTFLARIWASLNFAILRLQGGGYGLNKSYIKDYFKGSNEELNDRFPNIGLHRYWNKY